MLQAGNMQAFAHKMRCTPELLIEAQFKNAKMRFDLIKKGKEKKKRGTIPNYKNISDART